MLRLALIEGGPTADAAAGGDAAAAQYAEATARLADVELSAVGAQAFLAGQHAAVAAVVVLAQEGAGGVQRQAEVIRAAAQAGKQLLVELPTTATLDELEAIVRACEAAAVTCMPSGTGRFAPANVAIQTALAAGKLGTPGLLRIHRWEPAPAESTLAASGLAASGLAESRGAALVGRLLGELDLANWLFGTSPSEVYAVARPKSASAAGTGNYLQLHLGFAGGGMALVDYVELPTGSSGYDSLSVIGSTGAAYADDHHNMQLLFREATPDALRTGPGVIPLVNELREFTAAVRTGRMPSVTLADVRAALNIADAAQRSLDEGAAVELKG